METAVNVNSPFASVCVVWVHADVLACSFTSAPLIGRCCASWTTPRTLPKIVARATPAAQKRATAKHKNFGLTMNETPNRLWARSDDAHHESGTPHSPMPEEKVRGRRRRKARLRTNAQARREGQGHPRPSSYRRTGESRRIEKQA